LWRSRATTGCVVGHVVDKLIGLASAGRVDLSDDRPAIRMRLGLARDRQNGLTWSSDRYFELVEAVLSGCAGAERDNWQDVLNGHEKLWRAAYLRENAPRTPLALDLLEDLVA
jgi:hypothetical protein